MECPVDCEVETFVDCEQEMVGKCETECETTGGAIFCDGQFLDASDLQSCADDIEGAIHVRLDIDHDVDADVDIDDGDEHRDARGFAQAPSQLTLRTRLGA